MDEFAPRLRAVCDLNVAEMREFSGRHEYDGVIQDFSPDGVRQALAALADAADSGPVLEDSHDEAHLAAFEDYARVAFGDLELHRRNPLYHLFGLDLASYDRDYAPQPDRDRARLAHLAGWPQAVDAALAALDRVNAPVAQAMLGGIKGLAAGIPADAPPEQQHPAMRMIAIKRAHDAGVISDTEFEQAKDDLRRWGTDRGVST